MRIQLTFGVRKEIREGIMNPDADPMVRANPTKIPTKSGAMSMNEIGIPPITATENPIKL